MTTRAPVLLEICVSGVGDCLLAEELGADRVELNSALELGGLTPSLATAREAVKATRIPVIAMTRPRPGDFVYSEREFDTMLADGVYAVEAGAAGVAFGVLLADGSIDVNRCERFMSAVGAGEVVFHRAFDFAPDRSVALERLIEIGVTRVLTSGGRASAVDGAAEIAALQEQAQGRIEILPGAGVRASNAVALLEATGCSQLHTSASRKSGSHSGTAIPGLDASHLAIDEEELRALRRAIDQYTALDG